MLPRLAQLSKTLAVFVALMPAAAFAADEAQVLAAPCAACHGPDGISPAQIPSIAGKTQDELVQQLTAFRDAPPAGTTIMNRHMKGYDDAQIALLVQYFSKVGQ